MSMGTVSKMAIASVSIGTSAAIIKGARGTRRSITVQNRHATQDLFIGFDANVTTTTGLKVAAGASFTVEDYSGDIYGVASGASTTTNYLEVYGQ